MKTILTSLAAALALTSLLGAAHAADTADSVRITARSSYHLAPQDFREFSGVYVLSNGDTVKFSQRLNRYFSSVDGAPMVEIFAVAPDAFVTGNGAAIKFGDGGEELAINNYERLQVNAKLSANTLVTARR